MIIVSAVLINQERSLSTPSIDGIAPALFVTQSPLHPKSPPTSRLPLLLLRLRPRPPQNLQEVRRPPSHARVNIRLAGLDVVVEVIAKGLDVRDDVCLALGGEVAGEEHCAAVR